jgi:hypothetical protein
MPVTTRLFERLALGILRHGPGATVDAVVRSPQGWA